MFTGKNGRKLIQIALDWTRPKDPPMSLGHASILAYLTQHNVRVFEKSWSVNHPSFDVKQVVDFAMTHAATDTDFAIGAYIWNEQAVQTILTTLKQENFPGRLIVGGPQVSYVTDNKMLEDYYPQSNIFIRGYAEQALLKLIMAQDPFQAIKGVHYFGVPDLGGSATADLETLPSPFLTGLIAPQPFIRWETQRGCPFSCSFCQHRAPEKEYLSRRHLNRSRIEAEIDWIGQNPIIRDIAVLDPTFNSGPHAIETLDLLHLSGYKGKLSLQCRAEMVTPDFMRAVSELNQQARVVLEFGLQTIHKEEQREIERPTNLTKVSRILKECLDAKIALEISLIFGLPGQTLDSFKQSVDYCISLGVPVIHAFPLMLLRGTNMHMRKHQLGLIESSDIHTPAIDRLQKDIPHVVASKSFTYSDWCKMAELASWLETEYNPKASQKSSLLFCEHLGKAAVQEGLEPN